MLNPHHLELFYYVARHGGISRAVRHIPYGIQQPGVSGQILQLEEGLGVKLFTRVPFRLTREGEELYAFVRPYFSNLDAVEARLRSGFAPQLRLGAAEPILRDHLPTVLDRLRAHQPKLQLQLRSGYQLQLEAWLLDQQIDLAITALETRPASGLRRQPLVRLGLVLLVPRKSPLRTAAPLWTASRISEPLICLPASETVSRNFQRGLASRGCEWTPTIVASSLETVARFVTAGYGLGVGLEGTVPRGVRALPLPDFPPVEIAALWVGRPGPLVATTLACLKSYATDRWPRHAAG